MPAKRPDYVPGHYYHLFNRGAHKVSIFREEDNYIFVLRKIKAYCSSLELTPIAYCLLPNHLHFLIRQDGEHPAGLLPQRVFNSYSKAYNKRYGHGGTVVLPAPHQRWQPSPLTSARNRFLSALSPGLVAIIRLIDKNPTLC